MSTDELEFRLAKIRDTKFAEEVRHFILNLWRLFDGNPPPFIQTCIGEILDLSESQKGPVFVRLSR